MQNCFSCQRENDADAKFCNSCGNLLPVESDPSSIKLLVLSATQNCDPILATSSKELDSSLASLFVLSQRAFGLQYAFLSERNKGNNSSDGARELVEEAALAILLVDENFLASQVCLDLSERLMERREGGESVYILPVLKSEKLKIDNAPFSGIKLFFLSKSQDLSNGIQHMSTRLACNTHYQGEMSLYGWLLQQVVFKSESPSKKFLVNGFVVSFQRYAWENYEFTLSHDGQSDESFAFRKMKDASVATLSTTLGSKDGRPHSVKGIAL